MELVNRVAQSGLVTLNLEDFSPKGPVVPFDLKDFLFMGLILKEKDFREALKNHDWSQYKGKIVAVFCSADAIVPLWAYMLVASEAVPFAEDVFEGRPDEFLKIHFSKKLAALDVEKFRAQRVVVKGCSEKEVPPSAYLDAAKILRPVALSVMFGEPCSTVPIFKAKKEANVA